MKNLIHNIKEVPKDKRLIVFDLDGTLTESKAAIDSETALLLGSLLKTKNVAIIGGGSFERFKIQLLDRISGDAPLVDLFLLPLSGGSFYRHQNGEWQKIYSQTLSKGEKEKIRRAFEKVFKETNYIEPSQVYGEQIEDRGSQITFSALGQEAPLAEKTRWSKEHHDDRSRLAAKLQNYLLDMEVKTTGLTSIDITRKGIDKEFGIEELLGYLDISVGQALFVGDALEAGGNDSPVLRSEILSFEVKSIEDTKNLMSYLLGID